jgi:hypothetical protein
LRASHLHHQRCQRRESHTHEQGGHERPQALSLHHDGRRRSESQHQQQRPKIIDLMLLPMEFLVEENVKEPDRDGSDWQINPENERPMQMLHDEGTEYRSDDGGKSPNP